MSFVVELELSDLGFDTLFDVFSFKGQERHKVVDQMALDDYALGQTLVFFV